MPIKAKDRAMYGKAWREVRKVVLARADDACECLGECGADHAGANAATDLGGSLRCGAPNGLTVERERRNPAVWWQQGEAGECYRVKVVLTVAHLNHTPGDDRLDNLRAFCQRCHLLYDKAQHAKSAAQTRRLKAEAAAGPCLPGVTA